MMSLRSGKDGNMSELFHKAQTKDNLNGDLQARCFYITFYDSHDESRGCHE